MIQNELSTFYNTKNYNIFIDSEVFSYFSNNFKSIENDKSLYFLHSVSTSNSELE